MDGDDDDWTNTALFSPSKALVERARAKDWAVVDAWLAKKYSAKRLPSFERNEETLQVLLALADANDSADEQRTYLDRIDKAALSAISKRATTHDATYRLVLGIPNPAPEIATLAEAAVAVDCAVSEASALAASLFHLTSQSFLLNEQMQRVTSQIDIIRTEQSRLQMRIQQLGSASFRPSDESAERTAEWLRGAKHMRGKLSEYEERLNTISTVEPHTSDLDAVLRSMEEREAETARLSHLDAQLQAFQSLPTNAKAARSKVEDVRKELLTLIKERDRLFEQLADAP